ncbi:MAG: hypothetical protein HKN22_07505 [Bacteroidia bacterium]|nr:hypothetical protein [Bacteroidia bacterium]
MKRALVLSGGGAKGAFQFGALQFIFEKVIPEGQKCPFAIIAGVSVGALNGVMLAMNKYPMMKEIWENIDNSKVYTGKMKTFPAILKIAFGNRSVLSNSPLANLISKHVNLSDIDQKCDFRFGCVSLVDGEYRAFRPDDFNNNKDLQAAILASTVMPIVWEPVETITDIQGNIHRDVVDGGIRNISPLGDVIDNDPDEVIIINCNASKIHRDEDSGKNIFGIAKRSLAEIAINEIFVSDLKEFLKVNYLVRQADAQGVKLKKESDQSKNYKAFKTVVIEPDTPLGDALDFSPNTTRSRINLGYKRAEEAFKDFINTNEIASH